MNIGALSAADITGTIVDTSGDMGATYCLSGPGPLQPGQIYCPGVLDTAQAASQAVLGTGMASSIPAWGIIAAIGVLAAAMIGSRR